MSFAHLPMSVRLGSAPFQAVRVRRWRCRPVDRALRLTSSMVRILFGLIQPCEGLCSAPPRANGDCRVLHQSIRGAPDHDGAWIAVSTAGSAHI
jgi:hypothetical protein